MQILSILMQIHPKLKAIAATGRFRRYSAFIPVIILPVLLGACTEPSDFDVRFYRPPDPAVTKTAFVEISRQTGILSMLTLYQIDGKNVLSAPLAGKKGEALTNYYESVVRIQRHSDGTETRFVPATAGQHELAILYATGFEGGFFDTSDDLVGATLVAVLRADHLYRVKARKLGSARAFQFVLTDMTTGETVASSLLQ